MCLVLATAAHDLLGVEAIPFPNGLMSVTTTLRDDILQYYNLSLNCEGELDIHYLNCLLAFFLENWFL